MKTNNTTGFIQYLDNYKNQKKLQYVDFSNITKNINASYTNNNYSATEFIGKGFGHNTLLSLRSPAKKSKPATNMTTTNTNCSFLYSGYSQIIDNTQYPMYYNMYDSSIWNTSTIPYINPYVANTCTLSCCEPSSGPSSGPITSTTQEQALTIKLHKVQIDTAVSKLTDLIDIINQYEYKEDTDYNIDLKALHNIKEELILLNGLIGLNQFKNSIIDQILYFVQNLHVGVEPDFKHTVIYGPPGTGKTEIAKIMGKMYSKIGILKNNVFKKVTRNDLVAGYLGQTAIKTKKVITECLGGCLFIDEAYSLANHDANDSYSKECIDTICEALSDHKEDLMVIVAGYEEEMNETFFKANQGLNSRFIWRFKVDDYTSKELMAIFKKKVGENAWTFDCDTKICEKWFEHKIAEFKFFGRDMELLFSYTKISHGRRIYGKTDDLRKKITMEDLENGYKIFVKNTKIKNESRIIHGLYV